jgi:hypothetical protein
MSMPDRQQASYAAHGTGTLFAVIAAQVSLFSRKCMVARSSARRALDVRLESQLFETRVCDQTQVRLAIWRISAGTRMHSTRRARLG